jgi:N-acetylneuraminic acid mutarotase
MRWRWIMCGVLVLVSGCIPHPSTAQNKAFVHKLVGYCAQVDNNVEVIKKSPADTQPGKIANQLDNFARKARAQQAPKANRKQLDAMLTAFDDAARQYRAAQTALANGNAAAAQAATKQAQQAMGKANKAGRRYGMPPLDKCPKVLGRHGHTAVPAQLAAGWELGHFAPFAVQQVPAAVLNGRIWVAGGLIGPEQATKKTEFYDPTIHTWTPGPDLPAPLHHAMMVAYQNTLVVIGGFVPRGANALAATSNRVLVLNKAQDEWTEGPVLHHARAAGAAAMVGDKIVVVGGRTGKSAKPVTATEVFNGTSWRDAAPIPAPGDHLAAASDGKYLYAVGGRQIDVATNTAKVQRFDPATNQWKQLTPMPVRDSDLGAVVVHGQLITVGGESVGSVFGNVRAYNLITKKWSNLPGLVVARHGMGVAAVGNAIDAMDGAGQPGHTDSTRSVQVLRLHR